MGKVSKFEVLLDGGGFEYTAGQVVTGKVILQLSEPTETKGVFVKFKGQGCAKITEVNCLTLSSTTRFSFLTYFKDKQCVSGNPQGKKQLLSVAEYSFPFRYVLPLTLPSTFFNSNGYVSYVCSGAIDLPWKRDPSQQKPFVVHAIHDLNSLPLVRQPVTQQDHKNLCCLWCKSGPISAVVTLQKTGFVPGETIYINAEVINHSQKPILKTRAALKQKLCFHVKKKKEKKEKEVAKTKKGPIGVGETDYWTQESLQVPSPLVPTNLGGCEIIDVNYVVEFTVLPDAVALDLTLQIPVVIGTVPLYSQSDEPAHAPTFYLPQTSIEGASVVNAGFVDIA